MAIEKTMQKGSDEPVPLEIIELQQLVLGFFLFWDVLDKEYNNRELVETCVLEDWARKHQVKWKEAIQLLVMVKERFREEPWAHYIHCRNFSVEGWADMLIFGPKDNDDVLAQIQSVAASRPFPEQSK